MWVETTALGWLNLDHAQGIQPHPDGSATISWAGGGRDALAGLDATVALAAVAERPRPPRWLHEAVETMDRLAQAIRTMPGGHRFG